MAGLETLMLIKRLKSLKKVFFDPPHLQRTFQTLTKTPSFDKISPNNLLNN